MPRLLPRLRAPGVISLTVRSGHASARSCARLPSGKMSASPIAAARTQARPARSRNHATLAIAVSLHFRCKGSSRRLAAAVARARVSLISFDQPDQELDELLLLVGRQRPHDLRMGTPESCADLEA